jgi:hypothetical protein
MNEVIADSLATPLLDDRNRSRGRCSLATLGIYGVILYLVGHRTQLNSFMLTPEPTYCGWFWATNENDIAGIGIGLLAAFGLTRLIRRCFWC